MKKIFALFMVIVLTCTLFLGADLRSSANTGESILVESGFEDGIPDCFVANADSGNKATLTRVVKEAQTTTNHALLVSNRTGTTATNGVSYDLGEIVRQKDGSGNYKYLSTNGFFYLSAKVRLKNASDTAYVRSSIYRWKPSGNTSELTNGTTWWGAGSTHSYAVSALSWTEIGVRAHTSAKYYNFSAIAFDNTWLDATDTKIKLQFALFTDSACTTAYMGDYYLDDVSLFFVNGTNTNQAVELGTSLLTNSDFEDSTADYSSTGAASWGAEGTTWFQENGSLSIAEFVEDHTTETIDANGVHEGSYGLKVTERPGAQLGVSVDLTTILDEMGNTNEKQVYHISAYMKTVNEGDEMDVVPIWGNHSSVGNAYLEGDSALKFHVTNEWTEVGFDLDAGQYYIFNIQGSSNPPDEYNPNSASWSALRFNTVGTTVDYYIDDIKIWKTTYSTDDLVAKIEAMPSVEEILPSHRTKIQHIRNLYNMFDTTEQSEVTNAQKISDAESELAKFDTTMEFTCGTLTDSVLSLQPGKTYDDLMEGINATCGDVKVSSPQEEPVTEGAITTGMNIQLIYKDVVLQDVDVVVYGDGNSDGRCDVVDLIISKKKVLGFKELTPLQIAALKVDATNQTDSLTDGDTTQVRKYLVGLIQEF